MNSTILERPKFTRKSEAKESLHKSISNSVKFQKSIKNGTWEPSIKVRVLSSSSETVA